MAFGNAPEPFGVYYFRKTFEECFTLQLYLLAQPVVGNEVYVLQPVFSRYGNVASIGNEVDGFCNPEFYFEALGKTRLRKKTNLERSRPTFGSNSKI